MSKLQQLTAELKKVLVVMNCDQVYVWTSRRADRNREVETRRVSCCEVTAGALTTPVEGDRRGRLRYGWVGKRRKQGWESWERVCIAASVNGKVGAKEWYGERRSVLRDREGGREGDG